MMGGWRRRDFLGSAVAITAKSAGAAPVSKIEIHLPLGLLRLRAEGGLEGTCLGVSEPAAEVLVSECGPVLAAHDLLDRERIWQALLEKHLPAEAMAAADIALWDLGGKLLGLPAFRMAGGLRNRIPVCKVGSRSARGADCAFQARAAREAGYAAFRDHFSGPAESVRDMARHTREAAGDQLALIHSGGGRYRQEEALRVGRALQTFGYDAFEEPLANRAGLVELAKELDIPVAAFVGRADVAQALTEQVPDILRVEATGQGGFTGLMKTLRAAEAFGVACSIAGRGPLGGLVHAHAIGAAINARFFEEEPPEEDAKVLEPLSGPEVRLSTEPGFGVKLNWAEVEKRTKRVLRA